MRAVLDTNVIFVANGAHQEASDACLEKCIAVLSEIKSTGTVVIDDQYLCLQEYQRRTNPRSCKGVGDVFLKWLLQNQANRAKVEQISVTPTANNKFDEFPDKALQDRFDPSDRKFVAVAAAAPTRVPIVQAVDCKWLDWWPALKSCGVEVEFVCSDDICRFYEKKFPGKPPPTLPVS